MRVLLPVLVLLLACAGVHAHSIAEMTPKEVHVDPVNGKDVSPWCGDADAPCATLKGLHTALQEYQSVRRYVEERPPDAFLIQLHPGVYAGEGNRDIVFSWNVTVRAWDGAGTVTFDLQRKGRALYFQSTIHEFAQIEGIRFTNGYVEGDGGAIWVNETHVQYYDCEFVDNEATGDGGAVWNRVGHFMHDQEVTVLDRVRFINNRSGGDGGALALEWARSRLQDVVFEDNDSQQSGGAIHAHSGQAFFHNVRFFRNTANWWGGGLHVRTTHLHFYDCDFQQNSGKSGGAIHSSWAQHSEGTNTVFRNNVAQLRGGAMYIGERGTWHLFDCTITNNAAAVMGGGISLNGGSKLKLSDTLVKGNFLNPDAMQRETFPNIKAGSNIGYDLHCSDSDLMFNTGSDIHGEKTDRSSPIYCDERPMGSHCRIDGCNHDYCPKPQRSNKLRHQLSHLERHRFHKWLRPYFGSLFDEDIVLFGAMWLVSALVMLPLMWCCYFRGYLNRSIQADARAGRYQHLAETSDVDPATDAPSVVMHGSDVHVGLRHRS